MCYVFSYPFPYPPTPQQRIQDFRTARNLKEPGSGTPRHDRNSKPSPKANGAAGPFDKAHNGGGGNGSSGNGGEWAAGATNVHSGNKRKGWLQVWFRFLVQNYERRQCQKEKDRGTPRLVILEPRIHPPPPPPLSPRLPGLSF